MRPRIYSAEGIVLAKKNYSEADRIIILFSKSLGKISLIAKSVRKLNSRKRGSLEVFNQIKFSAAKSRGIDYLIEVEIINSHNRIKKSLKKASLAYYFMEIISRVIREDEPNVNLYGIVMNYLDRLENEGNLKGLKSEYIHDVMVDLGFWPKGKKILNPEDYIKNILERQLFSERVGKRLFS